MKKQYELLGVSENASNEEIEQKFKELCEKYRRDRFLEGEAGNEAARKLTEIQTAYSEIVEFRKENSSSEDGLFKEVETAIKQGDLKLAQDKLDAFNERTAEWHYLQSVVFYKKNWNNESKKQLEIAMQLDGGNEKYISAYDKLNAKMNSAGADWNKSSSSGSGDGSKQFSSEDASQKQMGGDGCMDMCCQICALNALINCCCNCR